ncbi:uncharacterized protein PFL1_06674 [Pseudozyma flocculosa PF-1]|uniref:KOW domain-containing protein n=2 Tax=Pseudozyma flocculosa TaxID=84751 RepID=A0A5C3F802_9BASI|nr:uncharacterized protein PFL1_06674 [Pseudozyma flocculosa PF-1]EPQ25807.1 hypothetical protein PFL1_06674 [Pseudozyma flocculosa PF-1]SPO40492.1 uncharacterized protein PSFLO_05974 [Pseudozyma flocculosa]
MSAPGTTRGVMRSLKHLQPPTKGSKFAVRAPTHAAHRAKFVHVKDRVPYWNIVPGDHVRLRSGRVGQKQGLDSDEEPKIRGEGIVLSIDREKNWVWLRDVDEQNQLSPKSLRHVVPRLVDPGDPSKGYGPNVSEIPRPVHYSNLMLKIPGSEQYAVRLSRSQVKYDKRKGMFKWKRFATIRNSEDEIAKTGKTFEKVEVPWPKLPGRKRTLDSYHSASFEVENETWAPWRPEDPVYLPGPAARTSAQSELHAQALRLQRGGMSEAKLAKSGITLPAALEMLKLRSGDTSGGKVGTYAGFKTARAKSAPIAQPPTPAEMVQAQRRDVGGWASDADIVRHRRNGGLAFAATDYLDIAPRHGPAHGGDWSDLPHSTQHGGLDGERDRATGRLVNGLSRNDVDRMPIELLMKNDLVNESGLKWRMRRWKDKKAHEQEQAALLNRQRDKLLRELNVLKI